MSLKIVVFYGSVREDRQGIKAARFVVNKLEERGHEVNLADPMDYKLPLLNKRFRFMEEGEAPDKLKELAGMIEEADAFVVVSAEYNHSMPPALTNMMDYFLEEYFFRPSLIVTYSGGIFGGVRAGVQLRSFLGELGTATVPSMLPIPKVQSAFDEEGNPTDEKFNKFIKQPLDELEWYAKVMKDGRKNYERPY